MAGHLPIPTDDLVIKVMKSFKKKHNIKPGTDEWFKLWFSLPYLTGERPI